MQVLVLAAPKKGVGRTTLAHRFAHQAKECNGGPIVLLDADSGGDLTKRCAENPQAELIVVPWDKSCTGPEFQRLRARKGGLIIVDAPLPEQREALRHTLSVADLIAVVVRPREDDFTQLGGVVAAVEAAARPFVFLVNRAKRHGNMAAATAIALAQYGSVCPIVLPEDERLAPSLRAKVFRRIKRSDGRIKSEEAWSYLSERLDAICGEADSEACGDPVDGEPEQRQFPRHGYDIGATFSWERQVFPCRIRNVSAGGLAFTTDMPVPVGTRLKLHVPYLGEFEAESVHRDTVCVGLRFVIDEWQQASLVRDLAGLMGAGQQAGNGAGGPSEVDDPEDAGDGKAPAARRSETTGKRSWFRKLA